MEQSRCSAKSQSCRKIMIELGQEICRDLNAALSREWLETNGIGGFSSSTITGLNTRRYHGLLTAATKPPVGRFVLLSKVEETLLIDGHRYDLSSNQYPGAVHPQGHRYLAGFRLDPFPTFVYRVEGIEITKRVFMAHGENTAVIEYDVQMPKGASACSLELRPLIAFRDYHGTTHHNDAINPTVQSNDGVAAITPYEGLPTLYFGHNADTLEESGNWYFNFEYSAELERGLDAHEDLFNPFALRFDLLGNRKAIVVASTQSRPASDAVQLKRREVNRRKRVVEQAPSKDPLVQQLTAAADQFIVQRGELNTVVAGYHWFAD